MPYLIPVYGRQRQAEFLVPSQLGLKSCFQDSQDYIAKPCLEKQNSSSINLTFNFSKIAFLVWRMVQ